MYSCLVTSQCFHVLVSICPSVCLFVRWCTNTFEALALLHISWQPSLHQLSIEFFFLFSDDFRELCRDPGMLHGAFRVRNWAAAMSCAYNKRWVSCIKPQELLLVKFLFSPLSHCTCDTITDHIFEWCATWILRLCNSYCIFSMLLTLLINSRYPTIG